MNDRKLFIFDCYDTLLSIKSNIAYKKFFLDSKVDFDKNLYNKILTNKIDWHEELRNYHSFTEIEDLLNDLKNNLEIDNKSIDFFDDSIEILNLIRDNGHSIILLSNLAYGYEVFIEKELTQYLDKKYYSFNIGMVKPDKNCFLYVINNFFESNKVFDKKNIYLIDDKIKNILSFNEMNMNGILIDRNKNHSFNNSIFDLKAIKKLI